MATSPTRKRSRRRGEGTIFYVANQRIWRGAVRDTNGEGNQIQRTVYGATREICEEKLMILKRRILIERSIACNSIDGADTVNEESLCAIDPVNLAVSGQKTTHDPYNEAEIKAIMFNRLRAAGINARLEVRYPCGYVDIAVYDELHELVCIFEVKSGRSFGYSVLCSILGQTERYLSIGVPVHLIFGEQEALSAIHKIEQAGEVRSLVIQTQTALRTFFPHHRGQ